MGHAPVTAVAEEADIRVVESALKCTEPGPVNPFVVEIRSDQANSNASLGRLQDPGFDLLP